MEEELSQIFGDCPQKKESKIDAESRVRVLTRGC